MQDAKKILITGGAGFIGTHLARALTDKDYQVSILDNLSAQVHGRSSRFSGTGFKKIRFIKGDIRRKKDVIETIKNQDLVVHLAAETGTGQSMVKMSRYADVNVKGTAVLLEGIREYNPGIKKIVVASSRAVYGEGKFFCPEHGEVYPEGRAAEDLEAGKFECRCPVCKDWVQPLPTDENSLLNPQSFYGTTKLVQEQMIRHFGKSMGIPVVTFRYQNVYGPGQSLTNSYTGILAIFSSLLKKGRNVNIFEDGKERRDFIYIDDAVRVTVSGIENSSADWGIFNAGTGSFVTVYEIAGLLKEKFLSPSKLEITGDFRYGDIRHNFADTRLTGNKLGFVPEVSLDRGLDRFVEWVNSRI
jgi:dTDP-L-rhamnose 4-epimerase